MREAGRAVVEVVLQVSLAIGVPLPVDLWVAHDADLAGVVEVLLEELADLYRLQGGIADGVDAQAAVGVGVEAAGALPGVVVEHAVRLVDEDVLEQLQQVPLPLVRAAEVGGARGRRCQKAVL